MKAAVLPFMLSLTFLAAQNNAWARDAVLPAGTIVQCTMNEPRFSSATVSVGDPVLCYPHAILSFGQVVFPRGAYFVGHLAEDKDPGHFWGKGFLKIEFDRVGLPSADVPLNAKIIAVTGGYRVDKDGKIIGKGHATRDTVEWLIPPLWPWKIITLPARGPRPTLKGETKVTLRLMDDMVVPDAAQYRRFGQLEPGPTTTSPYGSHPALYLKPAQKLATPSALEISWDTPVVPAAAQTLTQSADSQAAPAPTGDNSGWHKFGRSTAPAAPARVVAATPATPSPAAASDDNQAPAMPVAASANDASAAAPIAVKAAAPADSTAPAEEAPITALGAQTVAVPAIKAVAVTAAAPALEPAPVESAPAASPAAAPVAAAPAQKAKLTLLAVKEGTVYAVSDYWRDEDHLGYVLSNGKEGQLDLGDVDWKTTSQLNTERNVKVTLRDGR